MPSAMPMPCSTMTSTSTAPSFQNGNCSTPPSDDGRQCWNQSPAQLSDLKHCHRAPPPHRHMYCMYHSTCNMGRKCMLRRKLVFSSCIVAGSVGDGSQSERAREDNRGAPRGGAHTDCSPRGLPICCRGLLFALFRHFVCVCVCDVSQQSARFVHPARPGTLPRMDWHTRACMRC